MDQESLDRAITTARKRAEPNQPAENTDIVGWSHYLAHFDTYLGEEMNHE